MPCHDRRGIIKASPAVSCTSESAIMHGDGQRRGGEAQDKRTAYGGTQGGTGTGRRDGQRDSKRSHPCHTGVGTHPSLGGAAAWGKYLISRFV